MNKFSFAIKIILTGVIYLFVLREGFDGLDIAEKRKHWLHEKAEITDIRIRESHHSKDKKYVDSWVEYKYELDSVIYKNEELLEAKELLPTSATAASVKASQERYYKIGSLQDILVDPKNKSFSTIDTAQNFRYVYQIFFGASCIFVLCFFIFKDLKAMRKKA